MLNFDLIKNWYRSYLPKTFNSEDMIRFCYRSNQFLRITNPNHTSRLIVTSQQNTAYTDGKDCYIPTLFFKQEFYSEFLNIQDIQEQILACIALINGSQIHESIHIQLLDKNCNISTLITGKRIEDRYKINGYFYLLFNIVEDQFSENWFIQNYPFYGKFLELTQQIFFSGWIFDKNLVDYKNDSKNNDVRLKLLLCYRNNKNKDVPDSLIHTAVKILYQANDFNLSVNDRLNLAKKLFDLLIDPTQEKNVYSTNIDVEDILKKQLNELARNFSKDLEALEVLAGEISKDEFEENEEIVYQDIIELDCSSKITASENFSNFANYLKYAKAVKKQAGMPVISGSRISNQLVHRIAMDNKIFNRNTDDRNVKSEPEIIVLIDLSYSMVTSDLIKPVISTSKAIFESLFKAGLPIAIYGHTTNGNTLVFGIAANKMPLNHPAKIETTFNFEDRFNRVLTVDNSANRDGSAIQFVTQRFSNRNSQKTLLVLSDGKPSSYRYRGNQAEDHVKNVVNHLRESNVDVLSLSLVQEVLETNDKIYGQDQNVRCFGNNLESAFKQVVSQIIKRK